MTGTQVTLGGGPPNLFHLTAGQFPQPPGGKVSRADQPVNFIGLVHHQVLLCWLRWSPRRVVLSSLVLFSMVFLKLLNLRIGCSCQMCSGRPELLQTRVSCCLSASIRNWGASLAKQEQMWVNSKQKGGDASSVHGERGRPAGDHTDGNSHSSGM